MKNKVFLLLLLFALFILLAACSSGTVAATNSASASTSSQGATLVQDRCTVCHDISRVEGSRFSATQWKTVVDQMIAKGAHLTPDDETVVVQWLAANYGN